MIVGHIWKILLISIILSVLGLNVFFYIYRGAEKVVDTGAGIVESGISNVGKGGDIVTKKTKSTTEDILQDLEKTLIPKFEYKTPQYLASSEQQKNILENKPVSGVSGYCYIGKDKNMRTCSRVYPSEVCMSGDIFPTMDICINPKLRY